MRTRKEMKEGKILGSSCTKWDSEAAVIAESLQILNVKKKQNSTKINTPN